MAVGRASKILLLFPILVVHGKSPSLSMLRHGLSLICINSEKNNHNCADIYRITLKLG